jgi:hypothetical protein
MSIGLGIEAAGLGVEAAQVSRFAVLPVRWPRVFCEMMPVRTTLASPGSIAPGLQEVAPGHLAFQPRICP